ncbi:MAG: alpha/beta hydrolase [Gemmatimonadales bacterium]|nr:MAG: alpha/beta hydrolase [Gemmatimonadales bacterium]
MACSGGTTPGGRPETPTAPRWWCGSTGRIADRTRSAGRAEGFLALMRSWRRGVHLPSPSFGPAMIDIVPVRSAVLAGIFLAAGSLLGPLPAQAQIPTPDPTATPAPAPPAGSWTGTIEVGPGMELPLVLHVNPTEDGGWSATLDSPAQGATGIPVASTAWEDGVLTLEISAIGASYRGRLDDEGRIAGEFTQGGRPFSLVLERTEDPGLLLPRPQHPEPPFPYRVEEVRFENPVAGIQLAGTLTLPPGDGPWPAVVLVTGSGPQDRDETLLGHKPFLVIADHLTRAGIAVLRYDDRGVAESEGDFESGTTFDFAEDAAAAVAFLREHAGVDRNRVGIAGHSEGGLIAPLVATGHARAVVPAEAVAFVVLLAGPGEHGGAVLLQQAEAISRAMGMSDAGVDQLLAFQRNMQAILREEDDADVRRSALETLLEGVLEEMGPEARVEQGIPAGQEEAWVAAQLSMMGSPWFRTFLLHDPRPALEALEVPVLGLFGELDLQVLPEPNRLAMAEALDRAPTEDVTLLVLPGLNHLFQTAESGAPSEYASIEETFAPAALDAIRDWILARFGS